MKKYLKIFLLALAIHSQGVFAKEKVDLTYEDYFGDYFSGVTYSDIEIDLNQDSPASLFGRLRALMSNTNKLLSTDLLVVAYGEKDVDYNYFAATRNLENSAPFASMDLFKNKGGQSASKFFMRWIHPYFSKMVSPNEKLHFPLSPWRHLPLIGRKVTIF